MLHIVVADDDRTIREGIRAIIESLEQGHTIDTSSADGQTALEKVLEQKPDVLITDIKMPVMSGIELQQELHNRGLKVKTIVLSGYDDFAYVRESLVSGAIDYLLKPIDKRELFKQLETIERLKEEERKHEELLQKQLVQAEESTCLMKERLLWDLVVRRNAFDSAYLEGRIRTWGLHEASTFLFAVMERDTELPLHRTDSAPAAAARDSELWDTLSLRQHVKKLLGEQVLFSIRNEQMIVLFPLSDTGRDGIQAVENRLRDLIAAIHSSNQDSYTVGLSEPYSSCIRTEEAYLKADLAVQRKFYEGRGAFYRYPEGEPFAAYDPRLTFDAVERLHAAVEASNPQKAKCELSTVIERLIQARVKPALIREALGELTRALYSRHEWLRDAADLHADGSLLRAIGAASTAESMQSTVASVLYKLVEQAVELRTKREDKLIAHVKAYIQTNYHQPITLKQVAQHVNLTPNYLSQYFKAETGIGFMDYLLETRMKAAKKLLAEPDVKIYDVGYLVGYDNPSSFNRAFKCVTGMTPAEFRKHV